MLATDAAYFAGLLDGEGAFCLCRVKNHTAKRGWGWRPILQIANSSEEMVTWVYNSTGQAYFPLARLYGKMKRPSFRWQQQNPRIILPILESVRPYLTAKRQHADLLHSACSLLLTLPGRNKKGNEERMVEISPDLLAIRDQLRSINPKAYRLRWND
jgi:hypothetical protein